VILVLGNTRGGDVVDPSILNAIKKLLGIDVEDDSFDEDIKININTSILSLSQMGIGSPNGFIVTSADQKWDNYIPDKTINLEGVKTYIYLKTKLIFDPPASQTIIQAIESTLKELEFRMMLAVETNNLTN
jgi:hypothetical protein